MKGRSWIALVALAQIALLFGMAAQREWILQRAPVVWLRTAPVDPNDPMRGAYSRLAYDLNEVPSDLCRDGVKAWFMTGDSNDYRRTKRYRDQPVYASLETTPTGVTRLVALSDQRPASGLFIRGRVSSVSDHRLQVRYGIEAYFSDKREALKWEEERRVSYLGVPLEVEVALSQSGLAVLKSLRWEPLGIVVRVIRVPMTEIREGRSRTVQVPRKIEVEIKNHSEKKVGVVARPAARSFRLLYAGDRQHQEFAWINQDVPVPSPTASDIRILAPGESYRDELDVRDPYWAVRNLVSGETNSTEVISLEKIAGGSDAPFRIEYNPALGDTLLLDRELIRPQPLPSARWWASRGLD